jgi:DNA-binding winged helix-turn-helix (wHTH) protein/tetratricopeptide (TPR) repeat protein
MIFGAFRVDPSDERLLGAAGPIKLGNKAYQVLLRLIEDEGRLVTKDALFLSVWDGNIVSESALTSVVKELRRALRDESRTPRYIESVYGRGYRFIAKVQRVRAGEPVRAPVVAGNADDGGLSPAYSPEPATASNPALAVLPFATAWQPEKDGNLGVRMAEELIELLRGVRWIDVVAHSASRGWSSDTTRPREVGAALGARYVVEGRLQAGRDCTLLTAQASSAETGRLVWSRRMELPQQPEMDVLRPHLVEFVGALSSQIEDQEMRRAIALPVEALTVNDLIWRARWHSSQYTVEGLRTAEALLREALEKVPHSSEAVIQLAFCRHRDVWYRRGGTGEILELRRLAQRAISADEKDGRGYMVAGIAESWMRHSTAAIALLEQAIGLNPSLGYAHAQLAAAHYLRGRPELALALLDQALRLDVGEHQAYYVYGEVAIARAMLGQWDAAIDAADQSIMRRMGYWYAHVVKVHALLSRGDLVAAAASCAELRSAKPSFTLELIDWLPFIDRAWPERLKHSLMIAGQQEAQPASRQGLKS